MPVKGWVALVTTVDTPEAIPQDPDKSQNSQRAERSSFGKPPQRSPIVSSPKLVAASAS